MRCFGASKHALAGDSSHLSPDCLTKNFDKRIFNSNSSTRSRATADFLITSASIGGSLEETYRKLKTQPVTINQFQNSNNGDHTNKTDTTQHSAATSICVFGKALRLAIVSSFYPHHGSYIAFSSDAAPGDRPFIIVLSYQLPFVSTFYHSVSFGARGPCQ